MSMRRPHSLLIVVALLILALAAVSVLAGCRKSADQETAPTAPGADQTDQAADDETAPAGGAASPTAARPGGRAGGPGGRGGGPGGRGGRRGPSTVAAAPAQTATAPGAGEETTAEAGEAEQPEEGEEEAAETGIPEVDTAKHVEEFASLFGTITPANYGTVTRLKEQYWNDRTAEWILFTYTDDGQPELKGRKIKLPLSMVVSAVDKSVLDGYFPIYIATARRPSGEVISRQEISVPRASMEEYKKKAAESEAVRARERAARQADADAAAAAAGTTTAPGGGMRGGGMRGGGMRGGGMRGGGMRGGGMRGGF